MLRKVKRLLLGARTAKEDIARRLPRNGVGAEIGVWKGDFSALLLKRTRPRKLFLIDPWAFRPEFGERWYGGKIARSQSDMDDIADGVARRFAGREAVEIFRETSEAAAARIEDGSLDWAYVDGDHSYEAVLSDLEAYRTKVKPGAFLAGDDFNWKDADGSFPVRRAVIEFLDRHDLTDIQVFRGQFMICM